MGETDQFFNYYEILEVDPKASGQEIYQAYARIKKTYSLRNPDIFKSFTFDELQELLVVVEEAFATVGNKDTRDIYDQQFAKVYPEFQLEKLDFVSDEKKEIQEAKPADVPSDLIPAGFGKTSLSTYKVDDTLESMIAHQEFFDGAFLGKIRRYKNVNIEDLSKTTCISMKYLNALEDNNYNALPAAVFTRGYVNQYCKILNLNADRVIPSFMKLFNNERK